MNASWVWRYSPLDDVIDVRLPQVVLLRQLLSELLRVQLIQLADLLELLNGVNVIHSFKILHANLLLEQLELSWRCGSQRAWSTRWVTLLVTSTCPDAIVFGFFTLSISPEGRYR